MYVESVPNRNSPPAVLLRESFRQNGRVKKRTLANLSCWRPVRVEALRRALRGEFDQLPATPVCGPVFGLLFALKQLADELGLTAALGRTRAAKLALFLVLARLAHQGSRLSAVRWAADQAVAEVLGLGAFDEDDLYAALDDLSARQVKIEQALYRHYLERRGAPPSLLLYDVTSSYRRPAQRVGRVRLQSRRQARQEANCDHDCWPMTRASRWRCGCLPATATIRRPCRIRSASSKSSSESRSWSSSATAGWSRARASRRSGRPGCATSRR